jgi:hypothetical protein
MDNNKSYLYKIYRNGNFLGILHNVTSDFYYTQEINTSGSNLSIEVASNPDVSGESPGYILTQDGDILTDEDGNRLTRERADEVVGNSSEQILIRNGNKVEVFEISKTHPSGKLVFSGKIFAWEADYDEALINITCYSKGEELDNYLITGGTVIVDASQLTNDSEISINRGKGNTYQSCGQTWTTGAGVVVLGKIKLKLRYFSGPVTCYVKVYASVADAIADDTPLATASRYVTNSTLTDYLFTFDPTVNVSASTSYFFTVTVTSESNSIIVAYKNSDPYALGSMYEASFSGGGSETPYTSYGNDLYFETETNTDSVTALFDDYDPTDIVKEAIDGYVSRGGTINYDGSSTEDTGVTVDYTFKMATIKEVIEKCLELSPSDWYWYVDIGTGLLTYKQTSSTPDMQLIKGRDISSFKLKATIEYVKNILFFSGGNTGSGENLLSIYSDTSSKDNFGQQLETKSDNRVILEATADKIGQSSINRTKDEGYITAVEITDKYYDLTTINVGDTVKISGYGNTIDVLLLQIVRKEQRPSTLKIFLGLLPERTNVAIGSINNQLRKLQTIDNPDVPG